MRVGIIGRTKLLLDSVSKIRRNGHEISFIHTCRAENYYGADEVNFAEMAAELHVPFSCGTDLSKSFTSEILTGTDVAVSVNWPSLISPLYLNAFKHGILNAHAGDLPRYRGNACPNWAILNFEEQVALTIHRMAEELDAGPYVVKEYLPIDKSTYIGDIYRWLEKATPRLFAEAIERIGTTGFIEQDRTVTPSRMFPRRPEDGKIKWDASCRDILALVRASSHPFDGAFSDLEGTDRIRILRARGFVPGFDFSAVPGQVCLSNRGNPVIATGDGMVEIEECFADGCDAVETKAKITRSLRSRFI